MTTKTETKLFEMLTENTGTHFLDSGGAYGRHWQRNQMLTLEDFQKSPEAVAVHNYGYWELILNIFHYLNKRIELTETAEHLQTYFIDWANAEGYDLWACDTIEEFAGLLEDSTGEREGNNTIANSYNWENYLSQTIQYASLGYGGRAYVILQIHGGADVRGGYTRPQIFAIREGLEYGFIYDSNDFELSCEECDYGIHLHGPDVETRDGETLSYQELNSVDVCPKCSGTLNAYAPEPIQGY